MAVYPVVFNVSRPERFERPQVFLRILVLVILSIVGSVLWLIYLGVPVLAAIFISQKDGERYISEDAPRVTGWLRWIVAIFSYIAFLTDRFPTERPEQAVTFEVTPGGSPSAGSALLRLIYSIPSALALALLMIASAIVWIIAAVMVLIREDYSDSLYNFQEGVIRWEARLLAYHASLVEQYPPFSLETGPEPAPAV